MCARMDKLHQNKFLQRIVQGFFFAGFIGIVVTGMMMAKPRYEQAQHLNEKRDHLLQMIEEKQREIADIKSRQRRFNTDRGFVESLARLNRRVRPNEILFVFQD